MDHIDKKYVLNVYTFQLISNLKRIPTDSLGFSQL